MRESLTNMRRAIFPGTFDPFTIGHYSVVKRALTFMDEVVIGIGINENKKTWFPTEKRVEMIEKQIGRASCRERV